MIWYGRYNAILIVFLVVGVVISLAVGSPSGAFGVFLTVVAVRFGATVLNTLSKAFRGKPLICDVKIIDDGGKKGLS